MHNFARLIIHENLVLAQRKGCLLNKVSQLQNDLQWNSEILLTLLTEMTVTIIIGEFVRHAYALCLIFIPTMLSYLEQWQPHFIVLMVMIYEFLQFKSSVKTVIVCPVTYLQWWEIFRIEEKINSIMIPQNKPWNVANPSLKFVNIWLFLHTHYQSNAPLPFHKIVIFFMLTFYGCIHCYFLGVTSNEKELMMTYR